MLIRIRYYDTYRMVLNNLPQYHRHGRYPLGTLTIVGFYKEMHLSTVNKPVVTMYSDVFSVLRIRIRDRGSGAFFP
jgi:hypothetical protein